MGIDKSKSLLSERPDIAQEWHPTRNGDLILENIASKSHQMVWWKCKSNESHVWQAPPTNRNRKSGGGCPYCSNRMLSPDGTNSLKYVYPELAALWHPIKNGDQKPKDVVGGGATIYCWKCPEGEDHEWDASIHQIIRNQKRYSGNGCPVCRGLKVVESNCLETTHPDIAAKWDYKENKINGIELTPRIVTAHSNKDAYWQCTIIPRHKWKSKINNIVNSSIGCKYCHKVIQKSKEELVLLFELKLFWKNIPEEGEFIPRTYQKKNAKKWDVDIYIPDLKLGIEYDGAYYHSNSEKRKTDVEKTKDLESQGYTIIHCMQAPLEPINERNDVVFDKFRGEQKKIVNDTLEKIVQLKGSSITPALNKTIEQYIAQSYLMNEDLREDYRTRMIFEVLNEREEKIEFNKQKIIDHLDYSRAREFARSLKLEGQSEWKKYAIGKIKNLPTKPKEVPSDPYSYYINKGWKDWRDFLGNKKKEYREFDAARSFIHTLNLKNTMEWREYIYGRLDIRKPDDIPNCPDKVYRNKGWINMKDWLGKEKHQYKIDFTIP